MDPGDIRNIETMIRQFDIALNWMLDLGLEHATWMQAARDAIPVFQTVQEWPIELIAARKAELDEALYLRHEVSDFIRIHDRFSGPEDADVVRQKFKHVRRTSRSVLDEDTDGMPRNLVAELSFGAMLRNAGYRTDHSFDSDMLWFIPGIIGHPPEVYSVEVKRPSSIGKLGQNVAKGAEQVQKAVDRTDPAWNRGCPHGVVGGVVVVVCDRLIPRVHDPSFYMPQAVGDAMALMEDVIKSFAEQNEEALLAGYSFPATYGVRLWWRSLVRTEHPSGHGGIWSDFHQQHLKAYRQDPRWLLLRTGLGNAKTWSPPGPSGG